MLIALLSVCQQAPAPNPRPLDSAFIVGWIGDADQDGTADFAVAGRDHFDAKTPTVPTGTLVVYSGKKLGELYRIPFSGDVATPNSAHAIHDRDGDGLGDVLVCAGITSVFSSHDGKLLAELACGSAFVARAKDNDGDGLDELILNVADDKGLRPVVWMSKDGALDAERFADSPGWWTSVGDLDGDGTADLAPKYFGSQPQRGVISGATGKVLVALDVQPLKWLSSQHELIGAAEAVDLDGDGARDVVVVASDETTMYVVAFSGRDGKPLNERELSSRWKVGQCASKPMPIGDVSGDGRPDIVVVATTMQVAVLRGPSLVVLSGAKLDVIRTPRLSDGAWPGTRVLRLPDGDGAPKLLVASYGNENDDGQGVMARHFYGGWIFNVDARGNVFAKLTP